MSAFNTQQVIAAPKPIVGSAGDTFTSQQVIAALITITAFLLIGFFRRYGAARTELGVGQACLYAVHLESSRSFHVRGLIVGADNRTSTSKVAALLWTAILLFFIVAMALIFGLQRDNYTALITSISPLYLVLLGGPFAAVVLAKAVVGGAVATGDTQKSTAKAPRVTDAFSDDDGNTDLVDTQYLLFNVVVAGIVLVQFVHAPGLGAPAIPDFLAILTGSSAAAYVANKGVSSGTAPPTLDRVVPPAIRVGGRAAAVGANMVAQGDDGKPKIYLDGIAASVVEGKATQVEFIVPAEVALGSVSVTIRTPSGLEVSSVKPLKVTSDKLVVKGVDAPTKGADDKLVLTGTGFYAPADVDSDGAPLPGKTPAGVYLHQAGADRIDLPPLEELPNTDRQIAVQLPPVIASGVYELELERGGIRYPGGQTITIV